MQTQQRGDMKRDTGFGARTRALAMIVLVALGAIACSSTTGSSAGGGGGDGGPGTTAPEKPVDGGRLVFGVAGENDGFLPQGNRFGPSTITIARAVYDPLIVLGIDNKIHPYLAEAIYPSKPDFTEWEIKTRAATFHNGEKFDADALLVNLQAAQASALTSTAMKPITSITKVDATTVRISAIVSWANFPTLFMTQVGFIAAPAQVKAGDGTKPIGTGPFKFASWSSGAPFKATKNPSYWQPGLPHLDEVEFRAITDADSRRKALEANDIDVTHTNAALELIRSSKGNDPPRDTKVLVDESEGDEYAVVLNTQSGPFVDKNLRIALAKATDKEALIATQFDNFFEPADGPYSTKSFWHVPSGAFTHDLAGARKLVDEWKAQHGGAKPKFTYVTITTGEDQAVAQVLQQQWQEAGFEVALESQEEAKFSGTIVFGKAEAFAFKFFNSTDPDGDYPFWANETVSEDPAGISLNFPRYKSETVQAAITQGRANIDPEIRKAAYAKVWKDWAENVPYIFVFHSKWALIYNQRVHGLGEVTAPDGAKVPPIVWGSTFLTGTWIAT